MLHCMKIAIRSRNSFLIGSLAQKIAADGDDVCMIQSQHQHLPQDVDTTTLKHCIYHETMNEMLTHISIISEMLPQKDAIHHTII